MHRSKWMFNLFHNLLFMKLTMLKVCLFSTKLKTWTITISTNLIYLESLWCTPKLLDGFNYESKGDDSRRRQSWGALPGSQHFGGRRAFWCSGMGTRKINKKINYLHGLTQNQTISWLVRRWNTSDAWTSHMQTWTHKTRHSSNLGETTTFPLIVFSMPRHGANNQMSFCLRTPTWESRNSQNWDSHDFGGP